MPRPRPRGSAMDYESYLEKLDRTDEWGRKGATLSDKTARKEFGLTQDEIYDAIDAGTLQYRQAAMHGNPWPRLLRREIEALAGLGTATVTSANSRPGRSWCTLTARSGACGPSWPNLRSGEPSAAPIREAKRPGVVCRNKRIFAVMT